MFSETPTDNFKVEFKDETATVHLPPRVAVLEAVAFKQTCHQIIARTPPPRQIVFDCKQTIFIDSSGVGALVHNVKAAKKQTISLVLRYVQPQVMGVLSLTGLDRALTIEFDIEEDQSDVAPPELEHISTENKENRNKENRSKDKAPLPTTHPSVRSSVKRGVDILGAIVGLGITAILFLPIAIAIKTDSPGPILFSQIRCGWMGKTFLMWKFRSMCEDAEKRKSEIHNQIEGPVFKLFKNEADPRITRVGRFIRRTSLDELPQFWNVLKGEMSLVGTRPVLPDELESYEVPEWQRLDVKPGITGEWQVNGRSNIRNFEDVIRLDLQYQKNWSLLYDVKIIIKTIKVLLQKNNGAY
ncbi:MAG: anti-sigma factor antagonist [Oscillatoria sp. SIO1A7]|nr:anti-sigma factor antagonist [Oscillatoria sp. SIO1A7]